MDDLSALPRAPAPALRGRFGQHPDNGPALEDVVPARSDDSRAAQCHTSAQGSARTWRSGIRSRALVCRSVRSPGGKLVTGRRARGRETGAHAGPLPKQANNEGVNMRRKGKGNATIPAWVTREDPIFSRPLTGAALHVRCDCADCRTREHRCTQCGRGMGNEWILGPVCGRCCRANHRRVAGR